MTGIVGFYDLTMTDDLLPLLLTEKSRDCEPTFQGLKIRIEDGWASRPFINR